MRFIRTFQTRGTLLFVSHDMGAIQNLCKSALWLGHGQVQQTGTSKDVAEAYLLSTLQEVYGDKVKLSNTLVGTELANESEQAEDQLVLAIDYGSKFAVINNSLNATGWKTGAAEIVSLSLVKA
jgi:lipopolysaccharide transport system ATP-binding protein